MEPKNKSLQHFILLISILFMACQNNTNPGKDTDYTPMDTATLSRIYSQYREPTLDKRRITHEQISSLIENLGQTPLFTVKTLGQSVEQRNIYQLNYGSGPVKVMLWSQMHGDESTATMALFDLFNFLSAQGDGYDSIRNLLKQETTLMFIPMVNPDGAQRFMRRNSMDIDINRDARATTTPEGAILRRAAEKEKPQYGFNLHDQSRYYTAGRSAKSAAISFLAPAYNYERDVNEVRGKAMQLIAGMNRLLQQCIPGHVARYDDAHEPRGFGDNFTKWGASTILIESGGYPGDPEKQHLRKMNFMIILNALVDIARQNFTDLPVEEYDSIPENRFKLHELMLRQVRFHNDTLDYTLDVGIKRAEANLAGGNFYVRGYVDDIGDLQESFGYRELDASGLEYREGKLYPTAFDSPGAISREKAYTLLKQGYFAVKVHNLPEDRRYDLPLVILRNNSLPAGTLAIGSPANFFLSEGDQYRYAIVNGYLVDLNTQEDAHYLNYIR